MVRRAPDLAGMLGEADGALIIGDPALRIDPEATPFHVYDLGREWTEMTGLPMVFAVWAGPRECVTPQVAAAFQESCAFGLRNLERIVAEEAAGARFHDGAGAAVSGLRTSYSSWERRSGKGWSCSCGTRGNWIASAGAAHRGLTPASAL